MSLIDRDNKVSIGFSPFFARDLQTSISYSLEQPLWPWSMCYPDKYDKRQEQHLRWELPTSRYSQNLFDEQTH